MRKILTLLTASAVSLAMASAAHAAVYIPTKTTDSAGTCTPQDCSLREAILAANQNPGEDVILLHAGTYTLSIAGADEDLGATGDLDIEGNLILLGDGAGTTIIDGGGLDRIFQVPAGVTAEIRDVTLRNGKAPGLGGAILANGSVTIERCVLTGNSSVAGADGPGYGGALYSNGATSSLTVTDSTITGNTAKSGGGGLAAGGNLTLTNVTLSANHADANFGGGLYIFGTAHATANNITVAGNTALQGGGLLVENNPFIGTAPAISNSIIAGNTAATSFPDCWGPVDSSYNLIGINTGCNGPSASRNDQVGTAAIPVDPKLDVLQAAGGPTPTLPLKPGSPALDAGNPASSGSPRACEATDQRGAKRPATLGAGRCDLGAFEKTTACVGGGPFLCLSANRFQVVATWKTLAGATGSAQGVELTPDSGYFWFFDPSNVELTLKVLNACSLNSKFWVFLSGVTDVQVTLTVTDTKTGMVRIYTNPQSHTFTTVTDTSAFGNCP
jgi:CSLREA domain-containing protein